MLAFLVIVAALCAISTAQVQKFNYTGQFKSWEQSYVYLGSIKGNSIARVSITATCTPSSSKEKCKGLSNYFPESLQDYNYPGYMPAKIITYNQYDQNGILDRGVLKYGLDCDGVTVQNFLKCDVDFGTDTNFSIQVGGCSTSEYVTYSYLMTVEYLYFFSS